MREFTDRELVIVRRALESYARAKPRHFESDTDRVVWLRDREIAMDLALDLLGVRGVRS